MFRILLRKMFSEGFYKLSFLFIMVLSQINAQDIIVTTKVGKVSGQSLLSVGGKTFYSFAGIPYAEPPVKTLRLQKPRPVKPWNGVLEATKYVKCVQFDVFLTMKSHGQEDCLVVNVYTPNLERVPSKPLPVMVFFHGGAFIMWSGSNELFGPERFMDYDVVLVTLNYRLGALGFMSMGDDVMPGNLGLWDQLLALQWIQHNIADFGGDPQRVTLFGNSAGAMSSMFHFVSPQSKGLFHGAIIQSGVSTSAFLKVDKHPAYYARSLAAEIGCDPEADSKALLECLQKADADKFSKLTQMFVRSSIFPVVFKPIIDDFSAQPFLPSDSASLIESGQFNQVPIIIGFNQDEGLLFVNNIHINQTEFEDVTTNWTTEICPLVVFHRERDEVDPIVISLCKEISRKFFKGRVVPDKEDILAGFKDIASDIFFNAISSLTARAIAEKSERPVYEYMLKHIGSIGFYDMRSRKPWQLILKKLAQYVGLNIYTPELGSGHADEMFMMFKQNKIPLETLVTEEDKKTSELILKMWTNFARTGDPNPDQGSDLAHWDRVSETNHKRLEIDAGSSRMHQDEDLEKRINFWSDIWSRLSPIKQYKSSKTWKNPKMYRKSSTSPQADSKQEL